MGWEFAAILGGALVVSLLGCVMVSGILGGDMTASWAGIGLGVDGLVYVACDKSFERLGVTQEAMFAATESMIAGLAELEPMFLNL